MISATRRPLALFLAALAALSVAAHAQLPIKNVDEPGRTPFQQTILNVQNSSTCTVAACTVKFSPVPTGFRLVITHASALFKLAPGGKYPLAILRPYGIISFDSLILTAPTQVYPNSYLSAAPVSYYFEPGQTPSVDVIGYPIDITGVDFEVTLVGYLVQIGPPANPNAR